MKQIKKLLTFLLVAAFLGIFPKSALAFGITPAEIYVKSIKPGTHYESVIYLTRPASEVQEDLKVVLEPDLGDMEAWFSYEPGKEFDFPKEKNTTSFKVVINVPADAELSNYVGQITAKGISAKKAGEGVTIIKGAVLGVKLTTSDKDTSELKVLNMTTPDVESGDPVTVLLNVQNTGNTRATPDKVLLEVMDLFEKPLESLSDTSLDMIDPLSTKEIPAEFNSKLEKGQYRVDASVVFQGKEIARKKMVLTVNANPAPVTEKENQPEAPGLKGNKVGVGVGLGAGGILMITFALAVLLGKGVGGGGLLGIMKNMKALPFILLAAGIMMAAGGVYYYLLGINEGKPQQNGTQVVETPAITPTVSQGSDKTNPKVSGSDTEVKGVSTEATATIAPFVVKRTGGSEGSYPVYSEESFDSEIIYEAHDGDSFNVIRKSADWFNITLGNGTSGWLHKSEIKSKQ